MKRTTLTIAALLATLSVAGCGPDYSEWEDVSVDPPCEDEIDKLDAAVEAYRQAQKHEAADAADQLAEAAEEVLDCREDSK
jgi:hypothetical protein